MNDKPSDPTNFSLPSPISENTQPVKSDETEQASSPGQITAASTSPPVDSGSGAVAAHDVDLIEAEWVRKIEHVMRDAIDDPRGLSQRFSELKEEYIGTRYGKVMKQMKKDA